MTWNFRQLGMLIGFMEESLLHGVLATPDELSFSQILNKKKALPLHAAHVSSSFRALSESDDTGCLISLVRSCFSPTEAIQYELREVWSRKSSARASAAVFLTLP